MRNTPVKPKKKTGTKVTVKNRQFLRKSIKEAVHKDTIDAALQKAWHHFKLPDGGAVADVRLTIAVAVLTGLYAGLPDTQKFAAAVLKRDDIPLPEMFTLVAFAQADETIRIMQL